MPSLACEPDLAVVPFSSSLVHNTPSDISSDTKGDDEHPPPISPPALAPSTTSQLPRWIRSTCESTGDLVRDPTDQHWTRYQFQRASSILAQVSENYDPDTFAKA